MYYYFRMIQQGFDRILKQNMELLHTIHQSCNLHASSMLGIQEISKSVSHRLSEVEESIHSIDDRLRRAPSILTSYHSNVNQVVVLLDTLLSIFFHDSWSFRSANLMME